MTYGQLQLNEMMPANTLDFADQFNEFPDWIEIVNRDENSVQLDSFYLSDDPDNLLRWQLPQTTLPPGGYLLVFASGRNIRDGENYWHTLIDMGDEWQYHIPEYDIGDDWKTFIQNDTSWHIGKSGIGYEDGDDSTIIDKCMTLYLQKEFSIADTSAINSLSLYMDYDDGFVGYLNGTEFARSSNMGNPGSPVAFDAPATSGHEAVFYKSMPIADFPIENGVLQPGKNILAIEVHNVTANSSDMTAIPILLASANSLLQDQRMGNQHINLPNYFPHANFKIKANGEPLYICNNEGIIIDSMPMVSLPTDYSFGRTRDTKDEFGFFAEPSPGEPNTEEYTSSIILDSVQITNDNATYDTLQTIRLQSQNISDSIYYTLDGSDPNWDDLLFKDSIEIRKTTVVRGRILKKGSLPGPISTKTIFTERKHDINIFSIAMEPDDLWDYETGIYAMGPNADPKAPYNGANFRQDWERPAHFELLNPEGELLFKQSSGTKIFGARSRMHPQKSQTFYARSRYGLGEFTYPFFSRKKHTSYEAFIIRNSGNDWGLSMLRDVITASISEEMKLDHQAYEPVAQYINGEYWGLINMREKIHEHFIAAHYHVDPDEVNLIQGNMNIQSGSLTRYTELLEYLRTKDLTNDSVFSELKKHIDLDYFMRYWVLNVYINNKDWPSNNSKFWSTNTPGAQWRWIEYDTDFAYGPWGENNHLVNTLLFALSEGSLHTYANKPWATEVMRMLILNEQYQKEICNTFADGMNYNFHPDRMLPVIDSFQQRIETEASFHFSRWELSIDIWYLQVNKIRDYFQSRPPYMKQHLMNRFNISGEHNVIVDLNDPNGGKIRINTITPDDFPFEGSYFHNIPITLEAIPAPGYIFSHWEGDIVEKDSAILSYDMLAGGNFMAVFVPATEERPDLVINEINYCSSPDRNTKDWIELYNNSETPVDLGDWFLEDGFSGKRFYVQSGTILHAGGFLVVNHSRSDFRRYFPENSPIDGDMEIKFDSVMDGIGIYTPEGELHDYVVYESTDPWPEAANGTGATLELIHPDLDNTLPENWKAAVNWEGTPGLMNSVYKEVITSEETPKTFMPDFRVYPSPFREYTKVSFDMLEADKISICVYDISGRKIDMLHDGYLSEGTHSFNWKPENSATSGIYVIRASSAQYSQSLRVVYMR